MIEAPEKTRKERLSGSASSRKIERDSFCIKLSS